LQYQLLYQLQHRL